MVALCEEMPTFTDLDVVRDEQLCADTSRRFLTTIAAEGELPPLDGLLAEGYHDHVPSEEPDAIGMDAFRRTVEEWRGGFDFAFTVEDQIAQGDRVCTRWTWNATHTGDFLGIPASGRKVRMTGTLVHLFSPEGKITEGWWEYDRLGLMGQLGALDDLEK
jgi:predicted ester cyclase